MEETIAFHYKSQLPEGCTRPNNGDLLAVALRRVEDDAVWAGMVEGEKDWAEFSGDDPAEVAADCDKSVLLHKNFRALGMSIDALASEDALSHAEYQRHLENVRHCVGLIGEARLVFGGVGTAAFKQEHNAVMSLGLLRTITDFERNVLPLVVGQGRSPHPPK